MLYGPAGGAASEERGFSMMTEEIRARLFALRDENYRLFQARLMPTVDPESVIGVYTPALRALAKELAGEEQIGEFLADLPHRYYEENNLHGFIICLTRDFDTAVRQVDALLPYVDNWATCDQLRPRAFDNRKNRARLRQELPRWIASPQTYTARFGMEMAMTYFLGEDFDPDLLTMTADRCRDWEDYYVSMMAAWTFATALAKQWESTLPLLTGAALPAWVHNKTIQKAVESRRLSDIQKAELRALRRPAD